MNPLRTFCLVACLVAVAFAKPSPNQQSNSVSNSLKPSQWMSVSELEALPSLDEINLQELENMSVEKGAKLMEQLYHLAQMNQALSPSFSPSPSNIPAYIVKPNGQKITANLNTLVQTAKQQQNFGDEEVTIFITGLPEKTNTISKANKKLVQAYMERYSVQQQQQQQGQQNKNYETSSKERTSSEEQYDNSWSPAKTTTGDLIIIDLGETLNNFKRIAMLDVLETGNMIGNTLVALTAEADVPQEIIHIVAQGIAAPVAGVAAKQYTRMTGQKIRRITALDPSKIFAKNPKTLAGLTRGDAEFVDAIHSTTYGMGVAPAVGDVDFYPNGPSAGVPGAKNIVEASMRATRYFAESVRPGNERNFPAVPAISLQQYLNKNGYGPRAYMGIAADYDLEGDYILQVNAKEPFGKATPAQKQNTYHGVHQGWKNNAVANQDYD